MKIHSIFLAKNSEQAQIYANANKYHSVIFELKYNFIRNFEYFLESGDKTEEEIFDFICQKKDELTENLPTF